MNDTRSLPPAGWYPDGADADPSDPRLRWWDGAQWTAVTRSRASIERRCQVPSRAAVVGRFGAAALLVAVTWLVAAWAYRALERGCRSANPGAVDDCVSDSAFGVDMIALLVLVAAAAFVVHGFVGLRRRRRARRSAASPPVGGDAPSTTSR